MIDQHAAKFPAWVVVSVLGLCLVCAWLSVRNAAHILLSADNPIAALRFWPSDGVSLANIAQANVLAAGGTVDGKDIALAREALRKTPGAAAPLVVAGFKASADGNLRRAQDLMELAQARQPRTVPAIFWLLDHYIRTGDYAAGLSEITPAIGMSPAARPPLMQLVAVLATMPAARRAVLDRLAKRPRWRHAFFEQDTSAAVSPVTLLTLLEALPRNSDAPAGKAEQRAVFGDLIAQKDYARAYGAWLSFLPASADARGGTVYDPVFKALPGAEPFGWTLHPGTGLSVAMTSLPDTAERSGLAIEYRAMDPMPVAAQMIPVAAASYTLSLKARRVGRSDTGGRIVANVRCVSDDSRLATLPLDPLGPVMTVFQSDFVVPKSCQVIELGFSAEPGDTFGVLSAQLTSVRLSAR